VRLHTHASNLWNIRFSLIPSDHPLMGSLNADELQSCQHAVSVERVNTINKVIYRQLQQTFKGVEQLFELEMVRGLYRWSFSLSSGVALPAQVLPRLRELVLGDADDMITISASVLTVPPHLSEVPCLEVKQRGDNALPHELCSLRLLPLYYETQESLTDQDTKDVNDINASLQNALTARGSSLVIFELARDGGNNVVVCSLRKGEAPKKKEVEDLRGLIAGAVQDVLKADPTVLRVEDEMTQRGIAVAEQQIMESAEKLDELRQEGMGGMLRAVPVFGEVVNWLLPVAEADEGFCFDLTTSTLRKEERCGTGADA